MALYVVPEVEPGYMLRYPAAAPLTSIPYIIFRDSGDGKTACAEGVVKDIPIRHLMALACARP